ncbi:amino acid adenylation domain-containing protein [Tropicimonas aquimaris]|uniref:Amino acid adenylation domain-containing protein n=1 Tax=Tropicimonas aquimaris TaxID=914152 RepID=A0ABW3IXJ0_9RHOB
MTERAGHLAEAPLTSPQKMLWAGQQMAPNSPLYNMAWLVELEGSPDTEIVRRAFDGLCRSRDALRLVIRTSDAEPAQYDSGQPAGRFGAVDVDDAAAARHWAEQRIGRGFDLSRETFEAACLRTRSGDCLFYFCQHHIFTDAWSGRVLLEDLAARIAALRTGKEPEPASAAQFLPRALEPRPIPDAVRDHWSAVERDAVALPRLYGQSGEPGESAAVVVRIPLGSERSEKLLQLVTHDRFAALSRHQAAFNVYATALLAWMHRVSGQQRLSLGTVTHGRHAATDRDVAGCMVELFPLAAALEPDETFASLHAKVAEAGMDLLRNAAPGASTAGLQGGFNVVLNHITASFADVSGIGRADWLDNGHSDPRHAVRLNVSDYGESAGGELKWLFNASTFDAPRREAAQMHFLRLLDRFLDDPDARIGSVDLAGDDDQSVRLTRRQAEIRDEAASPVQDVLDAFAQHLADDPDATVIQGDGGDLDRKGLAARSDAIAAALADAGVGQGDLVGLHLTRSPDLVAAMLGALKRGAVFVPFDPQQPAQRLDRIAEEARPALVLSEAALAERWAPAARRLDLADIAPRTAATPSEASACDRAYVIFTSGSTGTPKGVVVGRAALSRYAHWAAREFSPVPRARWALHSATGFDLTITSIFAPLVAGGQIRSYREPADGPDLSVLRVFEEDAVDVVKLTPAHLALVTETPRRLEHIRSLVLGGEELTTALAGRAQAAFGRDVDIWNEYGPTEAVVGCMSHRFDPASDTGRAVPIGRPAAATAIYLLDASGNPAPDEVPAELFVGGIERLADGYFRNSEATDEAFLPDPFAPGRRIYRTGDLGSVARDGTLRYHGRLDTQLKLRGVRIEPAEIVAAAMAHPDVGSCVIRMNAPRKSIAHCTRCGVGTDTPGIEIDDTGVCTTCSGFDSFRERAAEYFGDLGAFGGIVKDRARFRRGDYDCLMLLSGGKDSSYALCRLAEVTPRILAATLDNGFISEGAKENIRRVTADLGIEHRFLATPAMNEIFVDSLKRHANVCNGCFKTIYTLGLKLARDEGIPLIVTGLSRGQMFETRLTRELFETQARNPDEIDDMVLAARRAYHRYPDTASQRLNGNLFDDDRIFDEVTFADFYRYCDVPVSEVYRYLDEKMSWIRPVDTGRSTNCLINDAGIHVHKTERGFHNYAVPYSWDVRMGHKTLEEAQTELDDEIDEAHVRSILDEIGYEIRRPDAEDSELICYYTGEAGAGDVRRHLSTRLPREMIPAHFVHLSRMPLTANGKIDDARLPAPARGGGEEANADFVAPATRTERHLAEIWGEVLNRANIGTADNYLEIGGDSIGAIQIAARCRSAGLAISPIDIFRHQTLQALAAFADGAAPPREAAKQVRASVDPDNLKKLAALLGKPKS